MVTQVRGSGQTWYCHRLGGGTKAPVNAGGDGSVPGSGDGVQLAGDLWFLLVSLRAKGSLLSQNRFEPRLHER